ncbi:hypothetical protein M422DRAFT_249212 [Sphaerobolus stellatus SS14]|nr:hypothetical protein M422DRAFT_249212 [Sphaerobolus stellatus SS14]
MHIEAKSFGPNFHFLSLTFAITLVMLWKLSFGSACNTLTVKWLFTTGSKNRCILKADSLLLCTIIEAVCADGTDVTPCIIMPPGETGGWMDVEGLSGSLYANSEWMDR